MIERSTISHHLKIFIFGCFFSTLVFSTCVHAIESRGEGINQRQALNAALRQAVEMSMGTEVETNTLVENFQVVRQQILNHTSGFVRSYQIISEDTSKAGLVRITIDAQVDDQSIQDSSIALSTLMKMAAHPRLYIVGMDSDFDAISSVSDEFRLLSEAVEHVMRDEFKFDVLDSEAIRLGDETQYRFTDRKSLIQRASRANADFIIFVEVLRAADAQNHPLTLRLETLEVASKRSLAKEEVPFSMESWTRADKNDRSAILSEAKDHIYAPTTQIAAGLIESLRQEVYEDGQRFELSFTNFDEQKIEFLVTDLTALSGYVRHELRMQKKKSLSLSYWSLLKAAPIHEEISRLLKGQDITFKFRIKDRALTYQYDDPMFE